MEDIAWGGSWTDLYGGGGDGGSGGGGGLRGSKAEQQLSAPGVS